MAGKQYFAEVANLLGRLEATQLAAIERAGERFAECIANEGVVHLFGSGHSVLPVMDLFPRYGSFVGFHPIMDPRLMWSNVIGPGGAPELIWIERQEGYVDLMARHRGLREGDVIVVYSHGGLNAAPIEMARQSSRSTGASRCRWRLRLSAPWVSWPSSINGTTSCGRSLSRGQPTCGRFRWASTA